MRRALLAIAVLFCACNRSEPAAPPAPPGPPQPEQIAEQEPNDRAVDATAMVVGKPVEGTYGWAEDEDWYRVEVRDAKPGQFLRVELTGVSGVRPEMEVRALQDGALLATVRGQIEGDGVFLRDLGLQLGAAATLPS